MSVNSDDKKKRFKMIKGGKTDPPGKTGKKRITNSAKPHIWVSRKGYGATRANDRKVLDSASELVHKLEKELDKSKPFKDKNSR